MIASGRMRQCYFDVTDVIHYAYGSARVSGIQRVQLNLIGHLVRQHGGELIRCTFEHPRRKAMVEFDPTALFKGDEFDAELLLRRLGLSGRSRLFPSPSSMRRYLRRYSGHNLRRAAAKLGIYLTALLAPARLPPMGLRRPTAAEMATVPVALRRIDRLPVDARLIQLGATWLLPTITQFGRHHAERGGELIQMIYDLIPQVHPEFFTTSLASSFNRWLSEMVTFTRRFVCISRWTAADLRRFIGANAGVEIHPIAMAHEFVGFDRTAPVDLPSGPAVEAAAVPFVLCVGTIEVRKNGAALLKAWQRLANSFGERLPRLVFAGKQGWLLGEFRAALAADATLVQKVRLVESPSDRELAFLYQRCLFTVFPSRYEGWGLPVGEAAWFGKYTISSNASSLPEVCGDLIDYFDPADLSSLCALLDQAIAVPEYVTIKEQALVRSPMRRWSDVADDLFAFIVHGSAVPTSPATARP